MSLDSVSALPWLLASPTDFSSRCREAFSSEGDPAETLRALANFNVSSRDSLAFSRAMKKLIASGVASQVFSPFRLGIVSHANYDLMSDALVVGAARHGVSLTVIGTDFGQIEQEAFDPRSKLSRAGADAVLLAVDHRWLGLEDRVPVEDPVATVSEVIKRIEGIVRAIRENSGCPTIIQTFPQPNASLFGNYDRRVAGAMRSVIADVNSALVNLAVELGAYLLDIEALVAEIGSGSWFDRKQWAAYKLPFLAAHVPVYSDYLGRLLGSIRGRNRKVLVLDLDNTVWGGVIGDDGVAGIGLGQGTAVGETYLEVQRTALALRRRGIVLAVCSKNTEEIARAAFREHPEMILKEADIAVFQANWSDKVSNLKVIAEFLNVGLDSLVFFDDNPVERDHVRQGLPMVAVPELPADPTSYPWLLLAPGYFEAVAFSGDDRTRAESYAANAQRVKAQESHGSIDEYLASLDMEISVEPFDATGRGRITQLINKTNQFNLTTRRYTEFEVQAMEEGAASLTLQIRLKDKFSDLGMIGVLICRETDRPGTWDIDTFLMSCRVLGRRVEEFILSEVVRAARISGVRKIRGMYLKTGKNGLVEDLYPKLGFSRVAGTDDAAVYELETESYGWESKIAELPFKRSDA